MKEQKEFSAIEQQRADILKELENEKLLIERYREKAPEIKPAQPAKPAQPKEPAKPKLTAPEPFATDRDGGAKSWLYTPATNQIAYIKADGTLSTNAVYDATAVLQGTAGNSAAKAWAKSNAPTITELASQQAAFEAQEKE